MSPSRPPYLPALFVKPSKSIPTTAPKIKMSDHIPFHIQVEILKRLPAKPLLKFRSVSKAWRSLIDSSEFIAAHSLRHNPQQHLLVRYRNLDLPEEHYVSFVDDDTFPQQRFPLTVPLYIKFIHFPTIIDISHGLLCLYDGELEVLLWNPSIRKLITIPLPYMLHDGFAFFLGFGVCPVTSDPKIVKITQVGQWCKEKSKTINHWKVMVYTLSSGKWRNISILGNNSSNLPVISTAGTVQPQVFIDRFIYWFAFHGTTTDSGLHNRNIILSFDVTNENFEVLDLPDSLARHHPMNLSLSKLSESVVMLESEINTDNLSEFGVWMMEYGVKKRLIKLFSIDARNASIKRVGFRKNGEPIVQVKDIGSEWGELLVCEPNSNYFFDLEIYGACDKFFVSAYMETLLLLGQSDCSNY